MIKEIAVFTFLWLIIFSGCYLMMQDWVCDPILRFMSAHADVVGSTFIASVVTTFALLARWDRYR